MENQNVQGFDFKKIPLRNLIIAGISLFGHLMSFLPWYRFTGFARSFYYGHNFAFTFSFRWLVFLAFIGIALFNVFGEQAFKMKSAVIEKINLFGSIGILSVCLIDLIRFIAKAGYMPSVGLIFAILSGVALLLFALKVIKIK
jgi:hypothetical protein